MIYPASEEAVDGRISANINESPSAVDVREIPREVVPAMEGSPRLT